MPGSFSIKLLLLLQAKHLQPAWRSCSLLLFYGYLSQSLSSHPEEISRKLTLVMTNTHQPQCPIPTKSAADRAGTLGVLEFCLFLTALSQAVHFTAWAQDLAQPKSSQLSKGNPSRRLSCQGIPASFARWRAAAKGDRQCGSSKTAKNLSI